jgi:hypothetical protein
MAQCSLERWLVGTGSEFAACVRPGCVRCPGQMPEKRLLEGGTIATEQVGEAALCLASGESVAYLLGEPGARVGRSLIGTDFAARWSLPGLVEVKIALTMGIAIPRASRTGYPCIYLAHEGRKGSPCRQQQCDLDP